MGRAVPFSLPLNPPLSTHYSAGRPAAVAGGQEQRPRRGADHSHGCHGRAGRAHCCRGPGALPGPVRLARVCVGARCCCLVLCVFPLMFSPPPPTLLHPSQETQGAAGPDSCAGQGRRERVAGSPRAAAAARPLRHQQPGGQPYARASAGLGAPCRGDSGKAFTLPTAAQPTRGNGPATATRGGDVRRVGRRHGRRPRRFLLLFFLSF